MMIEFVVSPRRLGRQQALSEAVDRGAVLVKPRGKGSPRLLGELNRMLWADLIHRLESGE